MSGNVRLMANGATAPDSFPIPADRHRVWIRDAALLLGVGLVVVGVAHGDWPWRELAPRTLDAVVLIFAIAVAGAVAAWASRMPMACAMLLAGVLPAALLWSGIQVVAATCALLLSGAALGTLFSRDAGVPLLVRWVGGMGLLAGGAGWLLPWPVHHAAVWVAAAVALVLLRRRQLAEDFAQLVCSAREDARSAPVAACCWALLASLVVSPAWLPAGNIDDLAYHLILGSELLEFGHARLDVGSQIWAMAPWSTDILHGLVSVMAGVQDHGPLNAWWTLLAGLLVRSLAIDLDVSRSKAWLVSMLYLSLPLTSFLSSSLQTESATPAMLVALVLAVRKKTRMHAHLLPLIAALAGFMLGAKLSSALLLLPVLVWLVYDWRRAFPWRSLPKSVLLGVVVCGSSYAYAGLLTGNPLLPLFNGLFQAPWFDSTNFVDITWQTGLSWSVPWGLVVDATHYFESAMPGMTGASGVAPLLLSAACIPALLEPRTRVVALVSLTGFVLLFSQVQYLRYVHPVFAVLIPATCAALSTVLGNWGWREALLGISVCLQAVLMPTSSWILSAGALRTLVLDGRQAVSDRFVPEREVSARMRAAIQPTDRVLYLDPQRSHGSELPGKALGTAWYTPYIWRIWTGQSDGVEALAEEIERAGSNYLLVYDLSKWPQAEALIARRNAVRIDHNGKAELYWLPPGVPVALEAGTADVQVGRPYPVVGQMIATVGCDRPGEPVAVAWTLSSALPQPVGLWEWVDCRAGHYATTAIQFNAGANAGAIHLTLTPAHSDSGMTLGKAVLTADVRRDFQAETALYRWLWAPFCSIARCESLAPSIVPLEYGPLLSYAWEADVPAR